MKHLDVLREHRACSPAVEFSSQFNSMTETINACERMEWLRWALCLIADKRTRVGIAAHIVRHTPISEGRTVYDLMTDGRSRKALDVCDAYARGEATDDEMRVAAYAASSASVGTGSAVAYAVASAAYAVASSAAIYAVASSAAIYAALAAAAFADAIKWQSDYIKSLDWDKLIEANA